MFYSPKHAQISKTSPARRRLAGVAVVGATAAVGSVAGAQSASASNVWDAVAQCESGGNWSTSTGNGFYGGLQFTHQTWQAFGGGQYAENANGATRSQQIEIAQKVLATQGPGAWPVCSQKAGLTSSNGQTGVSGGSSEQEAPVEEAPEQEAPVEEAPEQEAPEQEEAPVEEAPEQEAPVEEAPEQEEAPAERAPEAPSRSTERSAAPAQSTGSLAVDGIVGPNTAAAIEQWVGGSVDGDDWLSNDDIKKLQAKVGANQDGVVGPETISALQGVVGADQDGIWGPETTKALQQHLNNNL